MLELREYERCLANGSDSIGTQHDPVEDLPPGGEERGGTFAEAPESGQQRVAADCVGIEDVAVGRDLRGGMDADAGSLVALAREGGKARGRGAVWDDVSVAAAHALLEHLGQLRCFGRERGDALVHMPVARGDADADAGVAGPERDALAEPAQHAHRLGERGRARRPCGCPYTASGLQQPAQVPGERARDVEGSKMGDHVEPEVRIRSSQIQCHQGLCAPRGSGLTPPQQDQPTGGTAPFPCVPNSGS